MTRLSNHTLSNSEPSENTFVSAS